MKRTLTHSSLVAAQDFEVGLDANLYGFVVLPNRSIPLGGQIVLFLSTLPAIL